MSTMMLHLVNFPANRSVKSRCFTTSWQHPAYLVQLLYVQTLNVFVHLFLGHGQPFPQKSAAWPAPWRRHHTSFSQLPLLTWHLHPKGQLLSSSWEQPGWSSELSDRLTTFQSPNGYPFQCAQLLPQQVFTLAFTVLLVWYLSRVKRSLVRVRCFLISLMPSSTIAVCQQSHGAGWDHGAKYLPQEWKFWEWLGLCRQPAQDGCRRSGMWRRSGQVPAWLSHLTLVACFQVTSRWGHYFLNIVYNFLVPLLPFIQLLKTLREEKIECWKTLGIY